MVTTRDPIYTFRGHTSPITALLWDDSHTYSLASGDSSGQLKLWDVKSYKLISSWKGHEEGVIGIERKAADHFLISQGREGIICLWDERKRNEPVDKIKSALGTFCRIRIHGNLLCYPSAIEGLLETIDLETGKISTLDGIKEQATHTGMIMCCQFIKTSNQAMVGYEDGKVRLFDLNTNAYIESVSCFKEPVFCLDISKSGKDCVAGSAGNQIARFKYPLDLYMVEVGCQGISDVQIRNDGFIYVIGCWDGSIRIFDFITNNPLALLQAHKSTVNCLSLSNQSNCFVSGSKDEKIVLWKLY